MSGASTDKYIVGGRQARQSEAAEKKSEVKRKKQLTGSARYEILSLSPQSSGTKRNETLVKTLVGKFTFAIPEGHAQAGEKIEKTFEYRQTETDGEATEVMTEKKWALSGMVNDVLKANARSNAYQAALLPYRPSEVTPDEIKERMIRDYIRLGIPEDTARKQVEALLSATTQG